MTSLQSSSGSIIGGSLLVAGSCIGAAMLGLPVITGTAGFIPAMSMFFLAWIFMWFTGVLLLEVNLWFETDVSFVTMAGKTLGRTGKATAWVLYLFLFYCLLIAFISEGGFLVLDTLDLNSPPWVGSLIFTTGLGAFVYFGTGVVDLLNRILMAGLILSYFLLSGMSVPHINFDHLRHADWLKTPFIISAMITSFGYHNLIPSLTTYYKRNGPSLRKSFFFGTLLTLVIYLVWEGLILGIIPLEGERGLVTALEQGLSSTRALKQATESGDWLTVVMDYFSFFALVTTFITIALGFTDFLADGLHISKTPKGKLGLILLTLVPPLCISQLYPGIFLKALGVAGGLGAVTLFGILPVLMVWKGRYREGFQSEYRLPGGKATLLTLFLMAFGILGLQIWNLIY